MFDLSLHNGTVIDGTGAPRRRADVAVMGDRIAKVGAAEPPQARRVLDCAGLIVAPGFIDVHCHSDGWLLRGFPLLAKLSQGFTTEGIMADGVSYAPVTAANAPHWIAYLRAVDGLRIEDYAGWREIGDCLARLDQRSMHNVFAHVPYGNVRALACGWGDEPASAAQLDAMRREVRKGMEAGAVGVSTGLDYLCQRHVATDEIAEVCKAMAPWRGLYVTHVRYDLGVLKGLEEAVEIGRRADAPVHVSHLKGGSARENERVLDAIDRLSASDVDFSFDLYPYMASSTTLSSLLPDEVWVGGPLGAEAALRDGALRARFADDLARRPHTLDRARIAWADCPEAASLYGMTLREFVDQSGQSPADALCDLLIKSNLAVLLVFHRGDDALAEPLLAHPKCMIATDGIFFPEGMIHPRVFGTAPRVLGPLVRDRRLFCLEEAVRKLSGYPAERFGLKDRGVIRQGAFADLAVFDPDRIADLATYGNPRQLSTGMCCVLVNGAIVFPENGDSYHFPVSR